MTKTEYAEYTRSEYWLQRRKAYVLENKGKKGVIPEWLETLRNTEKVV
jgi:hypothetical protein